jgi:hypothetical protein
MITMTAEIIARQRAAKVIALASFGFTTLVGMIASILAVAA